MKTLLERNAAQLATLHDPIAFAKELYSSLVNDVFDAVFLTDAAAERVGFPSSIALVEETAAATGDVADAAGWISDATFNLASDVQSQGIALGVAFEQFRQGLIAALTINDAYLPADTRERVEQERAALRKPPAAPTPAA